MSDELSNATRIAALEADVVRLTAELQGEREDLDEISHSYGDALVEEAMLTRRIEELKEQVRQLTADNDTMTEAFRLTLIVEGELRAELTDRNAYAERLLAENVRLSNEAATERERCGVLEREVIALRAAIDTFDSVGTHPEHCHRESGRWDSGGPCKSCEIWCNAEKLRAETDTRHALDAANFVGGGQ